MHAVCQSEAKWCASRECAKVVLSCLAPLVLLRIFANFFPRSAFYHFLVLRSQARIFGGAQDFMRNLEDLSDPAVWQDHFQAC